MIGAWIRERRSLVSMADIAWGLLRHGYDALGRERAAHGGADDFSGRLLGRRAVVVRSLRGTQSFYDEAITRRKGAIPPPLAWLLFGRGAVHALDEESHAARKSLLRELLAPERLGPMVDHAEQLLRAAAGHWPGREVVIHDELVRVYGEAVLHWAGLRLEPGDSERHSRAMAAIVDGFGFSGLDYAKAWRARLSQDRWAAGVVRELRSGRRSAPAGSPLARLAGARELSNHVAGVELLNLIRPTVAVAWLGTFAAARLAGRPDWRSRVVQDGAADAARLAFAQEVRRTTPFAPALAGRVRTRADVGGLVVQPGDFLVLDIMGINHDPARWPDPDTFDPLRFEGLMPGPFDLVPQGGGDISGHRCPGEDLTLRLLGVSLRVLAVVEYEPVSSPAADRARIPTLPGHGLRVRVGGGASPVQAAVPRPMRSSTRSSDH